MSRPKKYEQPKNQYWVPKVYTSDGAPSMATADWKVASRDRDTGKQLMERSAIRNSYNKHVSVKHVKDTKSFNFVTNESSM